MKGNTASNIAKGGVLVALTTILLYAGNIVTINTFFLLGLACAMIPLCVLIADVKTAATVYAASAILSYFIVPDKVMCLYYLLFFGPYGLIKLFIEKKNKPIVEIPLKLAYFNITAFVFFILYKQFFMPQISMKYPIAFMVIIFNVAFIILDYALTVFANWVSKQHLK